MLGVVAAGLSRSKQRNRGDHDHTITLKHAEAGQMDGFNPWEGHSLSLIGCRG